MKKIIIIYILLAIGITSCNDDFLDVAPGDKLTDVSFWKTEREAFDALTAAYATFAERGSVWSTWNTYLFAAGTMTDDAEGTYNSFQDGSVGPTDGVVVALYKELYTNIRICNVFLANIDKPEMDENLRTRFVAEARFIRAFYYSILRNNWGGVPLIKEPLDVSGLKVSRSSAADVTAFIVSELTDAATVLPASYGANDLGRVTKGAALTLKARTLLYAGNYAEAAIAAQEVMALGYSLYQDAAGEGYLNVHQKPNEDNEEVIFAVRYNNPDTFHYYLVRVYPPNHTHPGGENGGVKIAQSFVNAFETTDGKTIDDATSIFDPLNEFDNRDPRLNMAVLKKGDILSGNPLSGSTVDASNNTGYYARKLIDPEFVGWGRYDRDIVLMRYAEVLLIYAEAKIENGSIDQSVLDAINDVRARAYDTTRADVANYPAITTTDQGELREIIRRERRVELGMEHGDFRFNDIRRWGIAETVLNGDLNGAKDGTGNYRFIKDLSFDASKHYLWPIPQREIDLVGSDVLNQNPGY
ncbi:RagB/SusD family nutrient uptake outer membrane protein [Aureibaculum sp. 2210JD6-5]|uniref:RagB/SusD family nutrient uptake outer membrane protein n=1 Tax=Aureibaculum sp. 2210JD6-5 TaxID=3103957 RepID=UPI002AAEDC69|nr:RagB/SusD family nutrient uptake outer membrane protein [Aureibaculum sp. 2210JD6-5]MDY7395007.1 RagB/SusD family nutrient uptake outer membrane protein [Aureibaculum sp. 2210JD6-5]